MTYSKKGFLWQPQRKFIEMHWNTSYESATQFRYKKSFFVFGPLYLLSEEL